MFGRKFMRREAGSGREWRSPPAFMERVEATRIANLGLKSGKKEGEARGK